MKNKLLPCIATFAVINAANALDPRQYIGFKISDVVTGDIEFDNGAGESEYDTREFISGGIAYGVKLSSFRVELEGNLYSSAGIKGLAGVRVQNTSVFVNAYHDIQTNSMFIPYVGVGMGFNRMDVKVDHTSDVESTLGLKAGFGVMWEINDVFTLDVGYRYNYFGSYSNDNIDASMRGSELSLGGHFAF